MQQYTCEVIICFVFFGGSSSSACIKVVGTIIKEGTIARKKATGAESASSSSSSSDNNSASPLDVRLCIFCDARPHRQGKTRRAMQCHHDTHRKRAAAEIVMPQHRRDAVAALDDCYGSRTAGSSTCFLDSVCCCPYIPACLLIINRCRNACMNGLFFLYISEIDLNLQVISIKPQTHHTVTATAAKTALQCFTGQEWRYESRK